MATRFILAFGISAGLIGVLTIAGWLFGLPALTTWIDGSMPMAPLTGALSAVTGASLAVCAFKTCADRRLSGLALSIPVLGISVAVVALRMFDRYPAIERLGIDIEGTLNGAPIGFVSSMTAGCFALASLAFIAQAVLSPNRQSQLATALAASAVLFVTGLASLLTTWLGFPLLAGPIHIPIAFNTSVVMLLVASALAMMVARIFNGAADGPAPTDRSWQPLAMTFVAVAVLTIGTGYAFYRQEEQEIRVELEARLEAITLVKTADAAAAAAAARSAGQQVRARRLPNAEWTLLATENGNALRAALWERLRWVLALAAMLLLSAGAVLTLIWRTSRIERYRERAALGEALRLQSIRLSELAARSPAVLYTLRVNGRGFTPADMSPNVERVLGYTVAEALDATWFPSHIHPNDFDAAMAAPAALDDANEVINEFRFIRKDGTVLWISNQMTVTAREAGRPVEVTGAWHDITERRVAESALRDSEKRLRLALIATEQGLWDLNVPSGQVVVSPEYATMLGYDPDEFSETHTTWRARLHPDDRESALAALRMCCAGGSDIYRAEYRLQERGGDWKWILSHGSVIARAADEQPLRVVGIHTDIHARKIAELRSEALLKEVHHRVKNNLQVISSLLRLEKDRHDDATVRSVMSEMHLRILSMALLHETLYRSHDLAQVDLGAYLADLANQVFRAAAPSTGAIALNLNVASVQTDMDHAIPCGLLVNEVLSNCLKHGFPDGMSGAVTIDLQPAADAGLYLLRISDTGVGLPPNFETRRTGSLGLHLIRVLARQLKATLTVASGPGASFSILFPPAQSTNGEHSS